MKQADMKQFWSHIAHRPFQVCPLFGKAETWQLTLNLKCKYAVTCARVIVVFMREGTIGVQFSIGLAGFYLVSCCLSDAGGGTLQPL